MEAFTQYSGSVVSLREDNIDTDQIIPKNFLKQVDKKGFGIHLFDEWRYLADGSNNPEFPLNFPENKQATILVADENFGSGSSREHAAWALQDYGFRAVIAGSFSDIFYMNALKNGLLPIRIEKEIRDSISQLPAGTKIEIDLPAQKIITPNAEYSFAFDATWKDKLVNGLDDISITLQHEDAIRAYEQKMVQF